MSGRQGFVAGLTVTGIIILLTVVLTLVFAVDNPQPNTHTIHYWQEKIPFEITVTEDNNTGVCLQIDGRYEYRGNEREKLMAEARRLVFSSIDRPVNLGKSGCEFQLLGLPVMEYHQPSKQRGSAKLTLAFTGKWQNKKLVAYGKPLEQIAESLSPAD